jgi:hypothetical protein
MSITSILKPEPDYFGFYYGNFPGTCQQINVRYERPSEGDPTLRFGSWAAYADGIRVGDYDTKAAAEAAAIEFLKERPQESAE